VSKFEKVKKPEKGKSINKPPGTSGEAEGD